MRSSPPKKISVVIPIYNEAARIDKALKIINKWHLKYPDWEFIVVNDGSDDETEKAVRKLKFVKLISYSKNQGKGYALKQGVLKAKQPLTLLCDVDFSTPLSEVSLLYPHILRGADFVIGSRKTTGAKIIKHQPWWRELMGRQFTSLSCLWLGLKVSDVTCGFKLLKTAVGKKIFLKQTIKRWSYDAEILFLAKKMGFKTVDVPVTWENDEKTKVNLFKDIARSMTDLIRIKFTDY